MGTAKGCQRDRSCFTRGRSERDSRALHRAAQQKSSCKFLTRLAQELLDGQESLRYELRQVKMQVGESAVRERRRDLPELLP